MARTLDGISFGAQLHIRPQSDDITDALGHDPRSMYVERFWLPVLGPSTTLLLRLLAALLDEHPLGCSIDIEETARSLGLGERSGRHGPFLRSISRAIDFDMIRVTQARTLSVRRFMPTLSPRHLSRLPDSLRSAHQGVVVGVDAAADASRLRGQQLALSLLEIGESAEDTVRQLTSWSIDAALARQCTTWARHRLDQREAQSAERTTRVTSTSMR